MAESPVLLCTNDDGINAPGLQFLSEIAEQLGTVWTVAPDREQSAASQALTLRRPLSQTQIAPRRRAVDGTPTDCVLLAIEALMDERPEIVLAGVNDGPNMGEDVFYSGTVAAAIEAALLGVPAIAISFVGQGTDVLHTYEELLLRVLRLGIPRKEESRPTLLNINLPDRPATEVKGVAITTLGSRVYHDSLRRFEDPMGRELFWIGGGRLAWKGGTGSDYRAVADGYVSVTPLHLDLTNYKLINELQMLVGDGMPEFAGHTAEQVESV